MKAMNMGKRNIICFCILTSLIFCNIEAQKIKITNVTTWEMIFSMSNFELTEEFKNTYPNAEITKTNVRFTPFFNVGEYWNFDYGNFIGLYTGLGIKNVGLISDERLPKVVGSDQVTDYKIIRRIYTAGIPLAIKLGNFKEHLYFFGGGEFEIALHYKEKYWTDTHSRAGSKTKSTQWFGDQTPLLMSSMFAGVQLPGGFNVKFKYYLNDFLDNSFEKGRNNDAGQPFNVSDLTRYNQSSVFYFSISWQFDTEELKKNPFTPATQYALN